LVSRADVSGKVYAYKGMGGIKEMKAMISSLIIGFLLASFSYWLITLFNSSYSQREKKLSNLLLKRAKKD
jgi:hypothetical protein